MIFWLMVFLHISFLIGGACNLLSSLSRLEKLTEKITRIKKGERDLIICGYIKALSKNLVYAQHYLSQHKSPNNKFLKQTALELLSKIKPYQQNAACLTDNLPQLKTTAYLENNPAVPVYWPNWTIRYKQQKEY